MIQAHIEYDYVVCDSDEWVEDRTDGVHEEADRAWNHAQGNGLDIEEWADKIKATGLYGEGPSRITYTGNEDNYLDRDLGIILLGTEKWGDLLGIADANAYGFGSWTIYTFNGDDDADAYGYTSGWASCDMPGCDAEWIMEGGGRLWQNGGRGTVNCEGQVQIADLITEGEFRRYATCPRCGMGELTFWMS